MSNTFEKSKNSIVFNDIIVRSTSRKITFPMCTHRHTGQWTGVLTWRLRGRKRRPSAAVTYSNGHRRSNIFGTRVRYNIIVTYNNIVIAYLCVYIPMKIVLTRAIYYVLHDVGTCNILVIRCGVDFILLTL